MDIPFHILEHHEAGMMANFEVVDPGIGELHPGQLHQCKNQNCIPRNDYSSPGNSGTSIYKLAFYFR